MTKIYNVIFQNGGKNYSFKSEITCKIDQNVIVETDRGLQLGKIISCQNFEEVSDEIKNIVRVATEDDYKNYLTNLKDAEKALKKCTQIVNSMKLNMKVANAQYNFDRSQLLFNFTADERIDFRELAKKLATLYHTRIELRQIGARDKAKEIGGIGICGRQLCCGSFLNQMETVSMNMAKNQNLALNPSKINGLCGRLLCCLTYEDKNYLESSKGMPGIGDTIETENGMGNVCSVDILNRKCTVLVNDTKEVIHIDENSKK